MTERDEKLDVLIASRDRETRERLRQAVLSSGNYRVAGTATDGQEAVQLAVMLRPDVALVEYNLPIIDGFKVVEMVGLAAPEVRSVLLGNGQPTPDLLQQAMAAGARAYLPAPVGGSDVVKAIESLAAADGVRSSAEFQTATDSRLLPKTIVVTGAKGGIGKIYKQDRVFKDNAHVMRVIERIILPLGRRIDENSPMVDARLPDGSRVNAIISPLAVDGPTITVRKFARVPYTVDDLVRFGTVTRWMADFMRACVQAKLNILVSGGTGSGKTTTLNVLSSFIPVAERIVTVEDAAELQLQQENVVRLESRPLNLEGRGEIIIRQLVRNALRMRPDRIIVGEVRGGEALDMLQAMNTGHEGSLSTAHTNSPCDALSRLETMCLMAGTELPSKAVREQIASALNLIIHQSRLRDGSRKVVQISKIQGMEGDVIILQDIFIFDQAGVAQDGTVLGEHKAIGLRPKFLAKLSKQGIDLPTEALRGG